MFLCVLLSVIFWENIFEKQNHLQPVSEAHLGPCHTYIKSFFEKTVNVFYLLTIFVKNLHNGQGHNQFSKFYTLSILFRINIRKTKC